MPSRTDRRDDGRQAPPEALPAALRWSWTALILALTVLPYLVCRWMTPKGFFYSWILPPYPADSLAYMAWSRQACNGRLLFALKFTALPHAPFVFHPLFLVCGWLARLSGAELGPVHLFVKSLGVILFFQAFFRLIAHLRLERLPAAAAAVLVGLSSGFGGILQLFGGAAAVNAVHPLDLAVVDSNTFWSLLWNPLFPYSLTLFVWAVLLMDQAAGEDAPGRAWLCGMCVALLALIHPYPVVLLLPLLALLAFLRRGRSAAALLLRMLAAAAPSLLYLAAVYCLDPVVRRHSVQGGMPGYGWGAYFFGFGLPGLAALLGVLFLRGLRTARFLPLILWAALALAMSCLPVWFRGKLIFGVHVPICILAALSFDRLLALAADARRRRTLLAAGLLVLPATFISQAVLLRNALDTVRANRDRDYMIGADQRAGLDFLRSRTRPQDIVLAPVVTSAQIAAFSGNTVLWGHWAQAVDIKEREAWYREVFAPGSGSDDASRSRRFWEAGVDYLYLDKAASKGPGAELPGWLAAETEEVFADPSVSIRRRRGVR